MINLCFAEANKVNLSTYYVNIIIYIGVKNKNQVDLKSTRQLS